MADTKFSGDAVVESDTDEEGFLYIVTCKLFCFEVRFCGKSRFDVSWILSRSQPLGADSFFSVCKSLQKQFCTVLYVHCAIIASFLQT